MSSIGTFLLGELWFQILTSQRWSQWDINSFNRWSVWTATWGGGLTTKSCPILVTPWLPGSSVHGILQPGNNTGVGCRFLLQGIFLTQDLNPVSCIAGRFFTDWAMRVPTLKLPLGVWPIHRSACPQGPSVLWARQVINKHRRAWYKLRAGLLRVFTTESPGSEECQHIAGPR